MVRAISNLRCPPRFLSLHFTNPGVWHSGIYRFPKMSAKWNRRSIQEPEESVKCFISWDSVVFCSRPWKKTASYQVHPWFSYCSLLRSNKMRAVKAISYPWSSPQSPVVTHQSVSIYWNPWASLWKRSYHTWAAWGCGLRFRRGYPSPGLLHEHHKWWMMFRNRFQQSQWTKSTRSFCGQSQKKKKM